MQAAFPRLQGDDPENDPALGPDYVLWASARARAGDDDGAIERLARAAACGMTTADLASYPELAALRSRADYPLDAP